MRARTPVVAIVAALPLAAFAADIIQSGARPSGENCLAVSGSDPALRNAWCTGDPTQLFDMSDGRTLKVNGRCLQYFSDNSVKAAPCQDGYEQDWRVGVGGAVMAVGYDKFGMCLQAGSARGDAASLQPCDSSVPAQVFRSSVLVPEAGDVIYVPFPKRCLDLSGWTTPVPFSCHGDRNQVFTYTFDSELRANVGNNMCLEAGPKENDALLVAPCSGADNQKWTLGPNNRLMPVSLPTLCMTFSTSPAIVSFCIFGPSTTPLYQSIEGPRLLKARSRGLKRTLVQAPLVAKSANCVAASRASVDVALGACKSDPDLWWEYTSSKTLRLPGNKCLDMSLTEANRVVLWDCNGQNNQQWDYDVANGVFTNGNAASGGGKCLSVNAADGKLQMQPCPSATLRRDNQFFQMLETAVAPPSMDTQQRVYCAARRTNPGVAFLRDTLAYAKSDFKYLVPPGFSSKTASNYYTSVVLETLSQAVGASVSYAPILEDEVAANLVATPRGSQVILELAELMCLARDNTAEWKTVVEMSLNIDKPTNSARIGSVTFLQLGLLRILGAAALSSEGVALKMASDAVANIVYDDVQPFVTKGDIPGLITYLSTSDMKALVQTTAGLCTAKPTLSVCSIAVLGDVVAAKQALTRAIQQASDRVNTTNVYLPPDVDGNATVFVDVFRRAFALESPMKPALFQTLLFGTTKPVATHPTAVVLRTMSSLETLSVLAVWPYFTKDEVQSTLWKPYFAPLSDQIASARLREISRLVYGSRVRSLEAYMGGLTSDMESLATEALPKICAKFPSLYAMCELVEYYTLVSSRAELQRTLSLTGGKWDDTVDALAAAFAKTFTIKAAQQKPDSLWVATAQRLVFNSVQLQVFDAKTLKTTARPESMLVAYTVLSQYSNGMASLLPFFNFLLDQVATAHFNAITPLVADRDVDAMAAYVDPLSNATVSDLGVFGRVVLPHICNNPNNPEFSVCKLQEFYIGLLQVVAFERSRARATTVSLEELGEVDVRKQLDVIDAENKQFEIITTIQDAANQIGKKIQEESNKIQAVVVEQSATIVATINSSRDQLYRQMEAVGAGVRAQIEASTQQLEDSIGGAVDAIRHDIASNTKLLYDKMSAEARKIQDSITENTRKLSTQIGAEAAQTRAAIQQAKVELSKKIDANGQMIVGKINESTNKLYNKIGEEGRAVRAKIDESTERLYTKIGDEGEKTRNKIDDSTRQLTQVINDSTAKLEGKIDESTKEVVGKVKSGFTALGNYFKGDALNQLRIVLKQIESSSDASKTLLGGLRQDVTAMTASLNRAKDSVGGNAGGQNAMNWIQTVIHAGDMLWEGAACFMAFAKGEFAEANPFGVFQKATDIAADVAKIDRQNGDRRALAEKGEEFAAKSKELARVIQEFMKSQSTLVELTQSIQALGQAPTMDPAAAESFVSEYLGLYGDYDLPVDVTDIDDVEETMTGFVDHMAHVMESVEVGLPSGAIGDVRRAGGQVKTVFSKLRAIFNELDGQFTKLGTALHNAASAQSAPSIGSSVRRLGLGRRNLETSNDVFKPFYSMAYASLSKLFMQYRIQKAAYDFCKFYEYKLGGVAPSMCTKTNAKYYTPADILKMRSYMPPTLRSYSIAALLPTRPTPVGSEPATAIARPRPYLDLDRLLAGEPVPFQLPTTDVAWLRKYNWILRTDTEATLGGIYVQSMQVILPFTTAANATPSAEPFDMVAKVAIGASQRLGPKNNHTYVLPTTELSFATAINAPLCRTKLANPYHEEAQCLSKDSNLCILEDATVTRTDLLPTIFSPWQISSPKELVNKPGAGYKLALPSTAKGAVDLNVIVLLNVLRVASTTASPKAAKPEAVSMTADTCCAPSEYYAGGACTKCPAGSTGALNGYSCQRM